MRYAIYWVSKGDFMHISTRTLLISTVLLFAFAIGLGLQLEPQPAMTYAQADKLCFGDLVSNETKGTYECWTGSKLTSWTPMADR